MEQVVKICVNSLRNNLIDNHDTKLKPAYGHELVAAYWGYKSHTALLEDKFAPTNNLPNAEFIVMTPDNFIDQRRKQLNGLPFNLPDSYILGEAVYAPLFSNKWWKSLYPPFRSFEKLARFIVENDTWFQHTFQSHKNLPMHHIVDKKPGKSEMLLTVMHCHAISTEELVADGRTIIKLPRVAGHIGYGKAQVFSEVLTGQARQIYRKNTGKQL